MNKHIVEVNIVVLTIISRWQTSTHILGKIIRMAEGVGTVKQATSKLRWTDW